MTIDCRGCWPPRSRTKDKARVIAATQTGNRREALQRGVEEKGAISQAKLLLGWKREKYHSNAVWGGRRAGRQRSRTKEEGGPKHQELLQFWWLLSESSNMYALISKSSDSIVATQTSLPLKATVPARVWLNFHMLYQAVFISETDAACDWEILIGLCNMFHCSITDFFLCSLRFLIYALGWFDNTSMWTNWSGGR